MCYTNNMKNFMKSKEKRLAVVLKSGFITQRKYDELFKIKAVTRQSLVSKKQNQ